MTRRTYTIIAVLFIIVLLVVLGFAYFGFGKKTVPQNNSDVQSVDTSSSKYLLDGGAGQIARDTNGDVIDTSGGPEPIVVQGSTLPPKLRHIYNLAQAGAGFSYINFNTSTTTIRNGKSFTSTTTQIVPLIRFIDRSLGHIYETATSSIVNTRISNTSAPKTYVAQFALDGKGVLLQSLINDTDTIASYFGNITVKPQFFVAPVTGTSSSSTTQATPSPSPQFYSSPADGYQIKGDFLANNIKIFDISPDQTKLFYLDTTAGDTSGVITNLSTGAKSIVWKSPLVQWNIGWAGNDNVLMWNAPSGLNQGSLYLFNVANKQTKLLISPAAGLTALSSPTYSTSKLILVGDTVDNTMTIGVLDGKTSSERVLPLRTLPEKCVWSKLNSTLLYCAVPRTLPTTSVLPDAWYQGLISFNDDIWSIDTKTGASKMIQQLNSFSTKAGDIDATNLVLNKTEDYLLFTNKKDLSLWGLRLIDPVVKIATTTAATTTTSGTSSGVTTR